ncbi:hypothetical protein Lal_00044920 [Lupinus albus]|nr:hypothetical protein Lal_00044920 [Lupinus albus]
MARTSLIIKVALTCGDHSINFIHIIKSWREDVLIAPDWELKHEVHITLHDGFSNKITFKHKGKEVVLAPLTPKQVSEDQRALRKKIEKERGEEKNERKNGKGKQILVAMKHGPTKPTKSNKIFCPSKFYFSFQEAKDHVKSNSRSNSFEEGGDDRNPPRPKSKHMIIKQAKLLDDPPDGGLKA